MNIFFNLLMIHFVLVLFTYFYTKMLFNNFINNTVSKASNLDLTDTDMTREHMDTSMVNIINACNSYMINIKRVCHIPIYNLLFMYMTIRYIIQMTCSINESIKLLEQYRIIKTTNDIIINLIKQKSDVVDDVIDNPDIILDDSYSDMNTDID